MTDNLTVMEEEKLYHFDLEFDENIIEFSKNLVLQILDNIGSKIHYVEFYNPLNTIEDLEELGVAGNYLGNPLGSYLEFVSNENLIADPVIYKYGIPLELGFTYLFEGITWLAPTIVYKYEYNKVKEKVKVGDLFYLETPDHPDLNPFSPRFFCKNKPENPKIWIENETILMHLTLNEKLEIELAANVHLNEVNASNHFYSPPETKTVPIELGVNN
jgi:hypothetical protein